MAEFTGSLILKIVRLAVAIVRWFVQGLQKTAHHVSTDYQLKYDVLRIFKRIENTYSQAYKILTHDGTNNMKYLSEFLTMTIGSTDSK